MPAARGHRVATRALCALSGWVFDGIKRREALHADGWHDMHLHARLINDPPPDV